MTSLQVSPRSTFLDPSLQASFERDGFVTIPLLNRGEVDHLLTVHDDLSHGQPSGFWSSIFSDQIEYRTKVFREITEIFRPKVHSMLEHYRPLLATFVVKSANDSESKLPLHQDWSFVDEPQWVALNVWCPLVDVDENNGPLQVVPKSHRLSNNQRGCGDGGGGGS
jgi:hypothetical protein